MNFRLPTRIGATPEPEPPCQRAAQAWDDQIGSARVQAKNWRIAAFGLLGLSALLAAGMIWQTSRGSITPWIVQADKFGEARAIGPAETVTRPSDPDALRKKVVNTLSWSKKLSQQGAAGRRS